jgi:type VI secretion system protein ImpK
MRSTRSTSADRPRTRQTAAATRESTAPLREDARGLHQLMYRACADVLATAAQLPTSNQLPGPAELRQQLTAAVDKVVNRGRRAEIPDADLAEARYALVALLDEQVLRASWSGRTEWMNRPLQFELYRDNNAGEDFFVRLSALLRSNSRPLAVQVYYLCLALGFQGMYGQTNDTKALAKFTSAARQQLAGVLPAADNLSPHGVPQRRATATARGPRVLLWASAVGVFCIIATILITAIAVQSELRSAVTEISNSAVSVLPVGIR